LPPFPLPPEPPLSETLVPPAPPWGVLFDPHAAINNARQPLAINPRALFMAQTSLVEVHNCRLQALQIVDGPTVGRTGSATAVSMTVNIAIGSASERAESPRAKRCVCA
jgi:hypothetical protein